MTEMRCGDQPDVDCDDAADSGKAVPATDPVLRRISSLPEDQSAASQSSPASPLNESHQAKSGSRPSGAGIVAERMKRFSEKGPGIERSLTTETGRTSPSSSSQSSQCSRHNSAESPSHSREPLSTGHQPTAIQQAAPPAEYVPEPEVNFPASAVVSFSLDECLPSLEQSARVEPSPERIYMLTSCAEEDEATSTSSSVASVDKSPMPSSAFDTHADKTAQKLRTFFGDDNVLPDQLQHSNELSDTSLVEAETKKNGGVKPADMSRGKKTWALATAAPKPGGTHSPGSRQRRSPSEKESGGSPKQKEHWTSGSGASPPSQTSRDKVAGANAGAQATWKDKVNPFKRHGSGSTLSSTDQPGTSTSASAAVTGAFGVPLYLCQPGITNKMVPLIVEICTRIVEEKGIENQGIYRVPGNSGAINSFLDELNKDPVTLCVDSDKWQDVNVVSSLLKLFFRKLPESLITDELYQLVIKANQTENSERRMLKLKKLLHELPEMNFETFRFLARHLAIVAGKEELNKMDARNLAIMFGPSLVRPNKDSMVEMVRDMSDQCRVVESVILHYEWFFSSWDEDVYVPVDEEADEAAPISSMNREMLAKAESLENRVALCIECRCASDRPEKKV